MIFAYFLLGLITGLFSGLLGVGGGIIIVPSLYFLLKYQAATAPMQEAIATSLATIVVTSIAAIWTHLRKGRPLLNDYLSHIVPGLIIGCIVGAYAATTLKTTYLREAFSVIAILLGVYFLVPRFPLPNIHQKPNHFLTLAGFIIGTLSNLLGLGGGLFTTPLFLCYRLSPSSTAATSSVCTLIASLIGTISFLVIGAEKEAISLINHRVFIPLALGALLTSIFGAKLSHFLSLARSKQLLGIILLITALLMAFNNL